MTVRFRTSSRHRILALVVVILAMAALGWLYDEGERPAPQAVVQGPFSAVESVGMLSGDAVSAAPSLLSNVQARDRLEENGRVEFLQEPLPSLTGTVAWKSGRAEAGLTVLGWPRSAPPSQADVVALLAGGGEPARSLVMATTDAHGRFVLSGVERDQVYLLTAGAPGLIGRWALASTSGRHRGPAELIVQAHHAVLVERVDQSGASIPRTVASFGPEYVVRQPSGDVAGAPLGSLHRALLGLSSAGWDASASGVLLSYKADVDEEALDPIIFHALQPGFETQSLELSVPRTTDGLKVVTLIMQPDGSSRGRVYIELIGWDLAPESSGLRPSTSAVATLKLLNRSTGRSTNCPIRAAGSAPILLDGVPFGTYTATLVPHDRLALLEPLAPGEIVVGPTAPSLIFDVRSLGRIEISLADEVSRFVPSWAMFNVFTKTPAFNSFTAFYSPPYVLEQVTPGDYTVSLYALDEPDGTGSRTVDITVHPELTTTVNITNAVGHEAPFEMPGAKR